MKRRIIFVLLLLILSPAFLYSELNLMEGIYSSTKTLDFEIIGNKIIFYDLSDNTHQEYFYTLSSDGVYDFIEFNNEKYILLNHYSILYFLKISNDDTNYFGGGSLKGLLHRSAEESFEKYSASSYLTEKNGDKKISYFPSNLNDFHNYLPWVEGVNGYGINEHITISMKYLGPVDNFVIYNGYIDPKRMDLYKANGRLKKASVSSRDFDTFEIEVKDTPNPQIFILPEPTDKFTITILDVYEGNKYEDLSISAITRNRNLEVYPPTIQK